MCPECQIESVYFVCSETLSVLDSNQAKVLSQRGQPGLVSEHGTNTGDQDVVYMYEVWDCVS